MGKQEVLSREEIEKIKECTRCKIKALAASRNSSKYEDYVIYVHPYSKELIKMVNIK